MRTFDFSPLYRSTVGFDRMFNLLDSTLRAEESAAVSYPPYNIEVTGEDAYRVTLAVAGFTREELTIEQRQNTLFVAGKHASPDERRYLHRGIATRAFERRIGLADHVKVAGASIENGLLHIDLVREIPEAAKPRRIEIGGLSPKVVEVAPDKAA